MFEFAPASGAALDRFCAAPGTTVLTPPQIADADQHWMAVVGGEVQARFHVLPSMGPIASSQLADAQQHGCHDGVCVAGTVRTAR